MIIDHYVTFRHLAEAVYPPIMFLLTIHLYSWTFTKAIQNEKKYTAILSLLTNEEINKSGALRMSSQQNAFMRENKNGKKITLFIYLVTIVYRGTVYQFPKSHHHSEALPG